jgi:hypothetical protein
MHRIQCIVLITSFAGHILYLRVRRNANRTVRVLARMRLGTVWRNREADGAAKIALYSTNDQEHLPTPKK